MKSVTRKLCSREDKRVNITNGMTTFCRGTIF